MAGRRWLQANANSRFISSGAATGRGRPVRSAASRLTVVQVAGEGGMGEDEVVEVGVLLECWKISSSKCECPGGEVATSV